TAIQGKEATTFKEGDDEIPVVVRLDEKQRENINSVENLNFTFRDMNTGQLRSLPIAALADVRYTNTFGGIRRKDLDRMVTISSNITTEFQPKQTQVVNAVKSALEHYPKTEGVSVAFTGEDEEIINAVTFLGRSLVISVFIILLILVSQFNS